MSTGSALDDLINKAREKRKKEEEDKKRQQAAQSSSALRGDRDDKTRTTSPPAHQQDNNHGIGYGSQQSHPTAPPSEHADWYKPILKNESDNNHGIGYGQQTPQTPKWKTNVKAEDVKEKQSSDNNHGIGYGSQTPSPSLRPMGPQPMQPAGPIMPTWRTDVKPVEDNNHGIGYGNQLKPIGPSQPGPMVPLWKAPGMATPFGDREEMDSATPSYASQVGTSTPRVGTGPTGIGALSTQPTPSTVATPTVQPWRPDWNLREQEEKQAGAFGGQRVTSPITGGNPLGYGGAGTASVVGGVAPSLSRGAQGVANWLRNIEPSAEPDRTTIVGPQPVESTGPQIGTAPGMGDAESMQPPSNRTTMGYPVDVNAGTPGWMRSAGDWLTDNFGAAAWDATAAETQRKQELTPGYEYYKQAQEQRDAAQASDDAANPAGLDWGDPWRLAKEAGRKVAGVGGLIDASIVHPIQTEKIPGLPVSAGDIWAAGAAPFYKNASTKERYDWNKDAAIPIYDLTSGGVKPDETPNAPTTAALDWVQKNLPTSAANILMPFLKSTGSYAESSADSIRQSIDIRERIDALPADQQAAGRMIAYNALGGPQNMQQRMDDWFTKDARVAELNKKAQEAQSSGDALAAAQYGQEAAKLKSMTMLEMADSHHNYISEIVGDLVLNPTNYIPFGEVGKIFKETKRAATYGIDAAKGVGNLDAAIAASEKILKGVSESKTAYSLAGEGAKSAYELAGEGAGAAYKLAGEGAAAAKKVANPLTSGGARKVGGVVPGVINDIRPWYEKLMPRNRTGQTRALQSTNGLYQIASQLIGNVTEKADARNLIAAWVDNPRALITQGVETAVGNITPGAGSIANQYAMRDMPVLQAVADKLKSLPSLAGDGAYTASDVAGDFQKLFYDGARSLFGQTPMELPAGATAFKLVKDGAIGKIQYVDKTGKVIKETQDVLSSAEATYKAMKSATKQAQTGGLLKGIEFVDDIQKHILSDMFLSRPSYMIKNAASAMAGLIPDGNYSTKTTPEITSWWSKKLGEFGPNLRTQAEMYGEQGALQNWTRKFWPTNNPYASTIETLQNLPRTLTKLLGGGVPLSEDKLYLNAADVAGQRAFRGHWQNTLQSVFAPALKELGIGDDVIRHLTQNMMAAGVDGSRHDVLAAAQAMASGKTIPFTLEHLGVPSETLSLDAWQKINQIFTEGVPEQADEAARMIGNIFHDETGRYAQTLLDDAPMPVQYEWTNSALQHDSAEIMDTITEAAKRAGGDQAAAVEQAKGVSQQFTQAVQQGWETFRNDLAQAQNANPDVAIDVYQKYNDILRETRAAADKLAKSAIKAPAEAKAAAWAEHQAGVAQLWQDAGQKLNEVFTNGRAALLQGGEYKPQNSWTDIVKRFIQYDDAAIAEARAAGGGLKTAGSAGYEKVIDAGRQYIDKSTYELFEAYRRAPSMENYDLMVDAMKKYETYGQQVRQYLQPLREAAMNAKNQEAAWARYYATRNEAWTQMFDNAVMYNNVNKRIMVANGVGETIASNLEWTDDFAGGTFKLVGPDGKGGWKAIDETGNAVSFSDPAGHLASGKRKPPATPALPAPQGETIINGRYVAPSEMGGGTPPIIGSDAMPPVPQHIIDEYNRALGNSENIVDEVVQDIAQNVKPPTAEPKIGDIVWRGPQGDKVVSVTPVGEKDGVLQYVIEGTGQTVPETELYEYSQGLKLRSIADAESMRTAADVAGNAPDQVAAAQEAAATMRTEWDRIARANKGYLKLENAAGLYVKDGIAQVPENKFEDLYGTVIAGHKINNSDDVAALLEEYAAMKRQAAGGESALQAAEAEYKRAKNALEVFRNENPYTVNPANPLDLHGAGANTNLYEQVAKDTAESLKNGGVGTLPYSHMSTYQIEQLRKAEQTILAKLPEILGGKPNTLTPGQSVALVDKIKDLIPHFDNAVTMASRAGEEAANFAMLNMSDRRNIDQVLALIMPYHYFFSRTPKNWAIRTLQHPSIARLWYDSQRAIEQENKDANLPTRMQGSIPNPLASYGVGPERISNPIDFMLPYAQFFGENEADDAPTVFEKYARPVMSQMYPLWQIAIDASLDKASPLPSGQKRTSAYEVGDYVPLYRAAGSVYQAMTGQKLGSGWTAAGDQFDPYRETRQVGTMGAQGDIARITGSTDEEQNAIVGKYANQIAVNIQAGKPANTDVPPEIFDTANRVYTEASKAVGYDQARSQIMNWVLGIRGHDVQSGEQAMRNATTQYAGLGYGPDNAYGSKEAKREFIDQNPMLSTWWGKNATVPGAEGPTPAASAQNDLKMAERDKLYADMNKAAEAYIQAHPEADKQELSAITQPYYDQIDALDKKYPNAAMPEGSGDPTRGMNPAERAQYELDGILKKTAENKPEYPVNGTPQQMKDYYAKLNEFTPQQRASVETALNSLLAMDETEYPGISQWKSELKKLVGNQYASEIIRYNGVKRASAAEQDWSERMAVVQELTDIQREKAKDRIVKEMGQGAYDAMQAYYALPKGGEERKAYEKEHPEVKRAIMAAYSPEQYEQAKKLFGADVWDVYFDKNYPQYPGDNASEADMQAYHDKLNAYNKANPRSEEVRMWVKGRNRPEGASGGTPGGTFSLSGVDTHTQIATTPQYNDFGTDWAEARRIFGPDIFKTIRRFPQTDDKKVIGKYLSEHPEITGYQQWKQDLKEHPERAPERGYTWDVPSATLRDAVQGQPRPLGSSASPIGSTSPPTVTPDMNANNHGIGYGAQTPPSASSGAAVPAELPSTTASAAPTPGAPATASDGTPMDMLDYARQDPKFVKREALNAEFAKRDEALTKQFGADSVSLYSQYHDLPKDSDARKKFLAEHPEVRQMDAWLYGRSAGRDKDSKAPPNNYGADYEEAKKKFGDHIWDLYGQYNSDWSKAQKKLFFNQHPEYSDFLDYWYGDDGKDGGTYRRRVHQGRTGEKHGGHKGPRGKKRGGYRIGNWYIDEDGVPHMGGPDGPVGPGPSGNEAQSAPQPGDDDWTGPVAPDMIGKGGVDANGVFRPSGNLPGSAMIDKGFSQGRTPGARVPPSAPAPSGPQDGESLDAVIAAYHEAAKEDPQNDWLTHMPPEVAQRELQRAIDSNRSSKRLQKPGSGGETKTLAELIALYREAAKEDPQNDWLTHLPPEVAQQELALALSGGSGKSYKSKDAKGWYSASGYSNSNNAYVPSMGLSRELQVNEASNRPWRPDWTSTGWLNTGRELRPGELKPWRAPR